METDKRIEYLEKLASVNGQPFGEKYNLRAVLMRFVDDCEKRVPLNHLQHFSMGRQIFESNPGSSRVLAAIALDFANYALSTAHDKDQEESRQVAFLAKLYEEAEFSIEYWKDRHNIERARAFVAQQSPVEIVPAKGFFSRLFGRY